MKYLRALLDGVSPAMRKFSIIFGKESGKRRWQTRLQNDFMDKDACEGYGFGGWIDLLTQQVPAEDTLYFTAGYREKNGMKENFRTSTVIRRETSFSVGAVPNYLFDGCRLRSSKWLLQGFPLPVKYPREAMKIAMEDIAPRQSRAMMEKSEEKNSCPV